MLADDSIYVSGTFWASIVIAVVAIAAIIVTLLLWRRGNPRRQITYDTRVSRLVSPHAPSTAQIGVTVSGMTFDNPYLLELRVESRSRRDIGSDDFDRQKPLVFRIEAPVAVQIGDTTVAESAEVAINSGVIGIGPCLIRKGTVLFAQFLTEGQPNLKTDSPLKDIRVAGKAIGPGTWPVDQEIMSAPAGTVDFRYHLVSIVAVFLALGLGLLVGATALQPRTNPQHPTSTHSLGPGSGLSPPLIHFRPELFTIGRRTVAIRAK